MKNLGGRPVVWKDGTKQIKVDARTHYLFKQLATTYNLGITDYLRLLSRLLFEDPNCSPAKALEYASQFPALHGDKHSMLEDWIVEDALKKDPEAKQAGWFNRNKDGSWTFDYARFEEYLNKKVKADG